MGVFLSGSVKPEALRICPVWQIMDLCTAACCRPSYVLLRDYCAYFLLFDGSKPCVVVDLRLEGCIPKDISSSPCRTALFSLGLRHCGHWHETYCPRPIEYRRVRYFSLVAAFLAACWRLSSRFGTKSGGATDRSSDCCIRKSLKVETNRGLVIRQMVVVNVNCLRRS